MGKWSHGGMPMSTLPDLWIEVDCTVSWNTNVYRTVEYRDNMSPESIVYTPRLSGSTYYEVSLRPMCYPLADATNHPF